MLGLIDNSYKDDNLCVLKLSLAKENYKVFWTFEVMK